MSNYKNDYTDEVYDRYMLTGQGAEYFEDNIQGYTEVIEPQNDVEYKDLNAQLDDVIRLLKEQIKEKERIIKAQKKKSLKKDRSTSKAKKRN